MARKTQMTRKQFEKIERLLLIRRPDGIFKNSIADVARKITVKGRPISVPTIGRWFPRWRKRSPEERIHFRRSRPFPEV